MVDEHIECKTCYYTPNDEVCMYWKRVSGAPKYTEWFECPDCGDYKEIHHEDRDCYYVPPTPEEIERRQSVRRANRQYRMEKERCWREGASARRVNELVSDIVSEQRKKKWEQKIAELYQAGLLIEPHEEALRHEAFLERNRAYDAAIAKGAVLRIPGMDYDEDGNLVVEAEEGS